MMQTRLEREIAARQSGKDADAAFTRACNNFRLKIYTARQSPLMAIVVAQTERAADLEQRRARRENAA